MRTSGRMIDKKRGSVQLPFFSEPERLSRADLLRQSAVELDRDLLARHRILVTPSGMRRLA